MPNIAQGGFRGDDPSIYTTELDYDYPYDLDLKPGSPLHQELVTKIMERARAGHAVVQKRFDSWNLIEQTMGVFMPTSEEEEDIKYDDSRKPVSIVFPYSYAIEETIRTYLMMAFVQDPIFRYEGRGPEDTLGALLLERLISLQCDRSKLGLSLHTFFRDFLTYGMGVGTPVWYEKRATITRKVRNPDVISRWLGKKFRVETEEDVVIFEGNRLDNVDPFLYLPDPNVAVHKIQDGEFVGWLERSNMMALLSEEKNSNGDIFNVRYLEMNKSKTGSSLFTGSSDRDIQYRSASVTGEGVTNIVDKIFMYITLIPYEWKLGDNRYPEKWLFGLANDAIIFRAQRANFNHDMYPMIVGAPDFDGYSATPLSRMEVLYPLQQTLDWLFNSHIANVRKSINDMLVVDPYLINIKDLKDPKPGKIIRMRRPGWGRGVENAVKQLEVNDITRGNIADSAFIVQWMQKIGAADDPAMGSLRQGGPERLTKAEFQGTNFGGVSRLQRIATVVSLQAMQDLSYMMASHTQQLMSQQTYIKATGEWRDILIKEYGGDRIPVEPMDISIDFDVIMRDGGIPSMRSSDVFMRLFETILNTPELRNELDVIKIFKTIVRNEGEKNVEDYVKIKPTFMPDEEVTRQTEAGNLIPLRGAQNARV